MTLVGWQWVPHPSPDVWECLEYRDRKDRSTVSRVVAVRDRRGLVTCVVCGTRYPHDTKNALGDPDGAPFCSAKCAGEYA